LPSYETASPFVVASNLPRNVIHELYLKKQQKIVRLIALHTKRERVRQELAKMDLKITQTTAWSLATEQHK